ncbi:hypothetical protein GGH93_005564 [Coemansia aciculifera]|nr:hypothetical protein GGH93_005564 [Coemansia aciculifera]
MDGEEVEQIFNTVEKLVVSHREFSTLFARVEATEKAIQDLRSRSTCTGRHAVHIVQELEEPALSGCGDGGSDNGYSGGVRDNYVRDIVKSITSKRLNEIGHGVSAKRATWSELRKQYSPKGSIYSPKRVITSKRATNTSMQVSEMDGKLAVDEVFSQVAAMTAYGVELLRIALNSTQVDRKLTKQASDIFATLCATLTGTLEQHRSEINSLAAEIIDVRRRAHGLSQESESVSEGVVAYERPRQNSGPKPRNGSRSKAPVRNERTHPYRRDLRHSEPLEQPHGRNAIQSSSGKTLHGSLAAGTRLSARIPSGTSNRRPPIGEDESSVALSLAAVSGTESTAVESVNDTGGTPVTEATVVVANFGPSLNRRSVIRTALLRQGQSESEITAFFNQVRKSTNVDYDTVWRCWVTWCIDIGLTCKLGDEGLATIANPESTHPSSLCSANYPLSKSLKLLRVYHASNASASAITKISMLVATACPNFTHVDVDLKLRNSFSCEMTWGTYSRSFESYADSIRRIIYKE